MRTDSHHFRSPQVVVIDHAELLSEFENYLRHTDLAITTIQTYLGVARHFLGWLENRGTGLSEIDDAVIRLFRDHDCHHLRAKTKYHPQRKPRGLLRISVNGVIHFVQFLECSGRTKHPGELSFGSKLLETFLTDYEAQGYRSTTLRGYRQSSWHFLLWLHRDRIPLNAVDTEIINRFLEHDCICPRYVRVPGSLSGARTYACVLRKFVKFLAERAVTSSVVPIDGQKGERHLTEFCTWLEQHRGLKARTIRRYDREVSSLLENLGKDHQNYSATAIRRVLLERFPHVSQTHAKSLARSMRMYLRFLVSTGVCPPNILAAVPIPRSWRLSTLPRYIPMEEVERVVQCCHSDRPSGIRDRAILLLLARLGLRAGDVCYLRLSDISWRQAKIQVRGKSKNAAALPLPQDVGDALLQYIQSARPRVNTDRVFLRSTAPNEPLADPASISSIVASALKRAGVESPGGRGAHLIRHSVATHMLRSAVPIEVIGALLRHESVETTEIYAKVDLPMLQRITQRWIGDAE